MKPDEFQKQIDALKAEIATLKANPTPALAMQLRQAEEDRLWREAKATADIADDKERAQVMLRMTPPQMFSTFQKMTPERALATIEATPKREQERLRQSIPPGNGLHVAMKVCRLPPPPRVKLTTADPGMSVPIPAITREVFNDHGRKARMIEHPSLNLVGVQYTGTDVGRCEVIMLREDFEKRLKVDSELSFAVERGRVVVADIPEEVSRQMLIAESQIDGGRRD